MKLRSSSSCLPSSSISQSFSGAIKAIMNGSYRKDFARTQRASSQYKKQKIGGSGSGNKKWSSTCEGALFLAKNFRKFLDSAGKEGFDPNLTSPREIDDIYEVYSVFHDYIRDRFSVNYISTAARFKTNAEKEGTRKLGKYF